MERELRMYDGELIARFDDTLGLRNEVFESVLKWIEKHNAHSGEQMQNDDFTIDAPELLADIIDDLFQFKTEWRNQDEDI